MEQSSTINPMDRTAALNRRSWIQSVAGTLAAISSAQYLQAAEGDAQAKDPMRVAIIGRTGKGDYGHELDTAWLQTPGTSVVAVADDQAEGLASAAKRLKVSRAFADYRQMLDEVKPGIACIAPRWIDKHHEMAMACAERGISMYMEKPFCRSLAEADEIIAACERSGAKLALAFQARYSPKVAIAHKLITDDKLGRILEYRARGKEDGRGGATDLLVLGPHMLDLIRYFGGQAQWCMASLTENGKAVTKNDVTPGAEGLGPVAGDCVRAMYGMPDDSTAYFVSQRNRGVPRTRFGLQVIGSEGVLEMTSGYLGEIRWLRESNASQLSASDKWHVITNAGIDHPDPTKSAGFIDGNIAAGLDLIAAIREDRQPLVNMYEARDTLEMIHAVFESRRQQSQVALPLKNRQHALSML